MPVIRRAVLPTMRFETAKRNISTPALPASAASICHKGLMTEDNPNRPAQNTTMATASVAPELMPSIDGSARGLRKSVCIIRPHTARVHPAVKAVNASGMRFSSTMTELTVSPPRPVMAENTSDNGIDTVPKAILAARSSTASMHSDTPHVYGVQFTFHP